MAPAPERPAGTGLALRHQRVQRLRRLSGRRSARQSEGAFVLEGAKLLGEALDAGARIESVYVAPGADEPVVARAHEAGVRVFDLAPGVLERVADTVTPQPVVAVAAFVDVPLGALRPRRASDPVFVVCVDVRDPGNAGTVLRSAEAAGAGGVVFCAGSVDLYNPKTVRASAGSLFHVPVVVGGDPVEVLEEMATWGVQRLATVAPGSSLPAAAYDAVDLTVATAVVLGNEAHGLPDDLVERCDRPVTIPMPGRSESLNVGMAAAVVCFEAARQRRRGGPVT